MEAGTGPKGLSRKEDSLQQGIIKGSQRAVPLTPSNWVLSVPWSEELSHPAKRLHLLHVLIPRPRPPNPAHLPSR